MLGKCPVVVRGYDDHSKVLTFREHEFSLLNRMAHNSKVKMAYKI